MKLEGTLHYAMCCAEKRDASQGSLVGRSSLLALISLCFAFLLALAMHHSSAMAAGSPPPSPDQFFLYTQGFCQGFSNQEVPQVWVDDHICDTNPVPDPEQTFVQPAGNGPCSENWIKTMNQIGQEECTLTVPATKDTCPTGFALEDGSCEYIPQNSGSWQVGFCKSFTSEEVPVEWISNHVCDINPTPDPEQTFIKNAPCSQNWVRTVTEGGDTPKCALTVPSVRGLCPIGFVLNDARCSYIPQNPRAWQFPCSDQSDGLPNERAISTDWLSGDDPHTDNLATGGGRFMHTFAADTYGLQSVQEVFSSMIGLAFILVTPMIILVGYQMLLAASCFRHAGALEGFSHILLGTIAIGLSFQLVTMLITSTNVINDAIVSLHGMLGYPHIKVAGIGSVYTLAGISEPVTSYRGIVMPISRWGCAINDFIGILGNQFFSYQVTLWFPAIGNLSHLAATATNGSEIASRLAEFIRMVLSVGLWLQVVIRIGILNCYILTCPLAFACWALPGGLGQQIVRQWTKGFLLMLFTQVIQLFLFTALPLILPSFPAIASDNGIMQIMMTQLPPLVVLWLTLRVPKLLGVSATRIVGMTGLMAGGIMSAVEVIAGR